MIAAAIPAGAAVLLILLGRAGLALLPQPPRPGTHLVAAGLDDRTWRAEILREARVWAGVAAAAQARDDWALARVHDAVYRRPAAGPQPAPGIDVIARWWPPAPIIGRPPVGLTLGTVAA